MTQEKPPRLGKPVLLIGKLLLLNFKHLEIIFAVENKIHNRENLSLFSQEFLGNRANKLNFESSLLKIFVCYTKNNHLQLYTTLDLCAHCMEKYGCTK